MKNLTPTLLALFFLISCSGNKDFAQDGSTDTLGKYIYLDDNGIYHINSQCFKLKHGKDDAGHEIYAKHLIDTARFAITEPEYFRVCSRCVNDTEYEHMLRISRRNQPFSLDGIK